MRRGGYSGWPKRAFDLLVVVPAIAILALPLLTVAVLVRVKLGAPILFRQRRAGLNGAPFEIFKFRTMSNERDASGELLPDEKRITRFGNFLRATSVDELPSLLNIVRGDLSLVGPRPLLMRYVPRYTAQQMRRHEVRPGLTGLAQVAGRNAIGWNERFALDVWYVDNASFWIDQKILMRTVVAVIRRSGISAEGAVTMPEFMGGGDDGSAV